MTTFRDIAQTVADKHGITVSDLTGKRRFARMVDARHELFYRVREDLGWSYARIAMKCDTDHKSVMYGFQKHEASLITPTMQATQDAARAMIRAQIMAAK